MMTILMPIIFNDYNTEPSYIEITLARGRQDNNVKLMMCEKKM